MRKKLWSLKDICSIAAKKLWQQYSYQASALAFVTLLGIVPLLSVSTFIISIFPIFTKLTNIARDYILTNFVPASREVIQLYFESFLLQTQKLPALSIVILIFSALLLIKTIENTINDIWETPQRTKK